jgi:hypothetical protein
MLQRIILPIYGEKNQLIFWQGRYCPEPHVTPTAQPKYWNEGNSANVFAIFGATGKSQTAVAVVEDFVSAVKVARICPAFCLFGSALSVLNMQRLGFRYNHLVLWLDPDKAAHAARCELKARPYFDRVSAVFTNKDPKEHSTVEIARWIGPIYGNQCP